jgi:hypothetical protein
VPWLDSPYSYAGWVPTITGHLSFSLIGGPRVSPRCRTFNRPAAGGPVRLIAIHQRRTAQDYILAPGTLQLARPQTTQDYILVARTWPADTPYFYDGKIKQARDDQGVLFGNILVVPRDRNPIIKRRRKIFLTDLQALLDRQMDPNADPDGTMDEIHRRIDQGRLDGIACLAMEVALFRTGEVRIWFDLEHFLGRQVHTQAIVPSAEELKLAELLAPQAYFFVKDITHVHYHHEPDSDQLLPLTRLLPVQCADDHDANELIWRRETLWGLARVVSQFRQRNKLYDFKKVMGVLAYADAFQSTLAMVWRRQTLNEDMELHTRLSRYDFAHTRSSVEAMDSLAAWRRSGWLQFFAIMIGVLFSSIALWAAAMQIRPIVCPELGGAGKSPLTCPPFHHPHAVVAVEWVTANPLYFTGFVLLIGFGAFILVIRDITFVPFGKRLQRALSRVSKAVGASTSRVAQQDSAFADWLGYLSSLAVLGLSLAGAAWLAVHRDTVGQWIANLTARVFGY